MTESRRSKRFDPNLVTKKIVPIILTILVAGLLFVVALIVLSAMGITPHS